MGFQKSLCILPASSGFAPKLPELSAEVRLAHQRFAHKKGPGTGTTELQNFIPAVDAALGYRKAVRRH
jgi:hypothetical protein